jgi:hypothetical protein
MQILVFGEMAELWKPDMFNKPRNLTPLSTTRSILPHTGDGITSYPVQTRAYGNENYRKDHVNADVANHNI